MIKSCIVSALATSRRISRRVASGRIKRRCALRVWGGGTCECVRDRDHAAPSLWPRAPRAAAWVGGGGRPELAPICGASVVPSWMAMSQRAGMRHRIGRPIGHRVRCVATVPAARRQLQTCRLQLGTRSRGHGTRTAGGCGVQTGTAVRRHRHSCLHKENSKFFNLAV